MLTQSVPEIVYEDGALAVVIKPVGMPAQPDHSQVPSLLDWAQGKWKQVYIINRLDRPAGGLLILAKSASAAAKLSAMIQKDDFCKLYLVLAENASRLPAQEGVLEDYLYKDGRQNRTFVVESNKKGAKLARLSYKILATGRTRSLIVVKLHTGRHHQIRAQLASRGCPVAGDVKYGASSVLREKGIALWSWSLSFQWRGQVLELGSKPQGRAWEPFIDNIPKNLIIL
ncbi:RNA pseudouridine synthase [bacterium]|nr:RNA pseudouridine synthase [bacterium]